MNLSQIRDKKTIQVVLLTNQAVVADQCDVADRFLSRLRGWMGVHALEKGQGLLLLPCNDIHMWFMKVSIDAIFLSREDSHHPHLWRVQKVCENLPPWKLFPVRCARAEATLELPAGTSQKFGLKTGDQLCIS